MPHSHRHRTEARPHLGEGASWKRFLVHLETFENFMKAGHGEELKGE